MVLKIVKYPNSILKSKSEEIKEITPEIKELALVMAETMLQNQGVGLAAAQIGISKRIIVVRTENGPEVFVNPKILEKSKEVAEEEEGCLCFPGIFLKIKRAKEIEIEALNLGGEKIKMKLEGLAARIFQHEIDHLDGILIIDRAGVWYKIRNLFRL